MPTLAVKAIFLALALIMGIVERWIPFDAAVPGVKLGLANTVILTAMYIFPLKDAFKISVLKCLGGALFAGTALSLLYSISGAMLSFAAMALVMRPAGERISPVGVSVVGAVFHNIGQIIAAAAVIGSAAVAAYLPALLISGVVTGVLVGVLVKVSVTFIRRHIIV